jgi:hypothetical protein
VRPDFLVQNAAVIRLSVKNGRMWFILSKNERKKQKKAAEARFF